MTTRDFDQYIMRDQYRDQPSMVSQTPALTVSDIERLAKVGVKFDLGTVFPVADIVHPPAEPVWPASLEDAFWQRWKRAHVQERDHYVLAPYAIHSHEYGDKVYVMVCSQNAAPFIIEDERPLYPSDALMAKLALYERTQP